MDKEDILKKIANILKDYDTLKKKFEPLEYIGLLGKDQEEITKINELITRIKAFVFSYFNENSAYFKQIELHSKVRKGICGRNELNMIIADLRVVYKDINRNFKSNIDSKQINRCVKRLYVFLKKYNIYDFFSTVNFTDALMEIDLDNFWEENIYEIKEIIAVEGELNIDPFKDTFIELLTRELLKNKSEFIWKIDHIVNTLIINYNIKDFDRNEFKQRIIDCGFNYEDINQMQCFKNKKPIKIIDETTATTPSEQDNNVTTQWKNIISEGENKFIEFKGSLRFDLNQQKPNKNLEYIIAKTLSAFLNTEGGTLLIGIADDGSIVGIENDYSTFDKKRQNKDGFLLKFGQIINNYLGKQFNDYIFPKIIFFVNKPICIIKIKRSDAPVFLKKGNKEEFFIRGPASSEPLSMKEALDYINSHWSELK